MAILHHSSVLPVRAARSSLADRCDRPSTARQNWVYAPRLADRQSETAVMFARDAHAILIPVPGPVTISKEALPSPGNTGDPRAMIA